jgi:transcriptional regulator with XRE-family HTH domain
MCQWFAMDTLPQLIRAARVALGLDQAELAEAAKIGVRSLSRLESGERSSLETLRALQRALEIRGVVFFVNPESGRHGIEIPMDGSDEDVIEPRRYRRGPDFTR